ncbi:hypothetical protein BKA65DRAFT_482401 [Rhexocercosporidium sp. MPI-PUGE-AT-0058]|nr:hypothetical protein BKA65DRAFT_482401 [Rhexocercosporidium sp. MPI-PUGE-AT-0058]
MASNPKTSSPSRWQKLVSFLDSFRGRPNTDLVRRNSATIVCGFLWLLITILSFPYHRIEIRPLPDSFPAWRSLWFSPLSAWPVDVVEKGLNISAEASDLLQIWGDRSELANKLKTGDRVVNGLLLRLVNVTAGEQPSSFDHNQMLVEYQQMSSTTSDKMADYFTSLHSLGNYMDLTSTKVENELTRISHDFQKMDLYRKFYPSIEKTIGRAFDLVYVELSPLLEVLVSKASNLHETLLDMERLLSILAGPETHIFQQSNGETTLGYSRPRHKTRQQQRSAKFLVRISQINDDILKEQIDAYEDQATCLCKVVEAR